jgi:hypothetical protein
VLESTSCDDGFLILSLIQGRKLSQPRNRTAKNPDHVVNILFIVFLTEAETN